MKRIQWTVPLALLLAAMMPATAEEVRDLHLLQDDAQKPMATKIYDLKYVIANDITPFVLGAIRRYNGNSYVDRINDFARKKQLLLVTTPGDMMPYVDEMVAKIDRPCPKDANGSIIQGDGIYRFAYLANFRSSEDVASLLTNLVRSGDGAVFFDTPSNLLYWKDSASDGLDVLRWAKAFDRPVPQAELTITLYEVRKNVLDDIGVDYLAWKNGPGLNMFSAGYENSMVQTNEQSLASMDKFTSTDLGGFFFAPQFDMSFVRMLSQAGNAKVAASGTLTVTNNYSKSFSIQFSPDGQNLQKDGNSKMSIASSSDAGLVVTVTNPIICFKRAGEIDGIYNGDKFDLTTYSGLCGNLQMKYQVKMNTVLERNNLGTELTQRNVVQSGLTFDTGVEHLLAAYDKKQKVEQTVGIPFLSSVPWLKYLCSTTTTETENLRIFVTIKARLIHCDDTFADWSGKIVQTADLKNCTTKE